MTRTTGCVHDPRFSITLGVNRHFLHRNQVGPLLDNIGDAGATTFASQVRRALADWQRTAVAFTPTWRACAILTLLERRGTPARNSGKPR